MYAPSSYNETVTGETLSSISEKSESYSNGDSNEDYIVSIPLFSQYYKAQNFPKQIFLRLKVYFGTSQLETKRKLLCAIRMCCT